MLVYAVFFFNLICWYSFIVYVYTYIYFADRSRANFFFDDHDQESICVCCLCMYFCVYMCARVNVCVFMCGFCVAVRAEMLYRYFSLKNIEHSCFIDFLCVLLLPPFQGFDWAWAGKDRKNFCIHAFFLQLRLQHLCFCFHHWSYNYNTHIRVAYKYLGFLLKIYFWQIRHVHLLRVRM